MVTKDKREELEQRARIALLNHYSSKSSNQVTTVLTIALGFFALITTIEPLRTLFGEGSIPFLRGVPIKMLSDVFVAFILSLLMVVGVRAVLRLFFYGELASLVLSCEMASRERTLKVWAENENAAKYKTKKVVDKMKNLGYSGNVSPDSIAMYMSRVTIGCSDLYCSKYLTESEEPYRLRWLSFRYARWLESFIVGLSFLSISIIYIVISYFF